MSTGNGSKQVRDYTVRDDAGRWLARVIITDDGYFSTVSDYGSYAFWWNAAGDCFRTFLTQVGADYLCGKLGSQEYDGEATEKAIKRHIKDMRRKGLMSREEAREEWDHLEESEVDTREGFAFWWRDTKLADAHEFSCRSYPSDLLLFAKRVWPHFVKALRADLERREVAA